MDDKSASSSRPTSSSRPKVNLKLMITTSDQSPVVAGNDDNSGNLLTKHFQSPRKKGSSSSESASPRDVPKEHGKNEEPVAPRRRRRSSPIGSLGSSDSLSKSPRKGIFAHRRISGSDNSKERPRVYNYEEFIYALMKNIEVYVEDVNGIFCIMKGIILTVPNVLQEHIVSFKKSHIEIKYAKYFEFSNDEVDVILKQIQIELEDKLNKGLLKKEFYQIFQEEKVNLLRQALCVTFAQAIKFKEYVNNYNVNKHGKKFATQYEFLIDYIFTDADFKEAIQALCIFVLNPPMQLVNLSIILNPMSFKEGLGNGDFKRTTLERISDEIDKSKGLSGKEKKYLAEIMFEKHKYIYICEDIGVGTFSKAIKELCLPLNQAPYTKAIIDGAFSSCYESLTIIEIQVIRKHLGRLLLGFIKWTTATNEDLLSKYIEQMQNDLIERHRRISALHKDVVPDELPVNLEPPAEKISRRKRRVKVDGKPILPDLPLPHKKILDTSTQLEGNSDQRLLLQDIDSNTKILGMELMASVHPVDPITPIIDQSVVKIDANKGHVNAIDKKPSDNNLDLS